MVLIWVSLATSNVECLFMCLLVICMSSLVKCHLSLLLMFNLVKLSSYMELQEFFVFSGYSSCSSDI